MSKIVRCNPDVAPRLTSGGYEDNQHIVHKGWRILIPCEDKVDVITPANILFIAGGEFEDKVDVITPTNILLPTYCS